MTGDASLLDAAPSAAPAMLRHHGWQEHSGGTATVSYYPNTSDDVINTAADVTLLLAAVAVSADSPRGAKERAENVFRLLMSEQSSDRERSHATQKHDQDSGGDSDTDNHHEATVVASCELLPEGLAGETGRAQAEEAPLRAVHYYLNAFCRRGGPSLAQPKSRRYAPVAGCSEGLRALLASPRALPDLNADRFRRSDVSSSLVHAHRAPFIPGTGDVACCRRSGAMYEIDSIRWGARAADRSHRGPARMTRYPAALGTAVKWANAGRIDLTRTAPGPNGPRPFGEEVA